MELQRLKNQIKENALSGFYILAGEEDYLKKYYLGEMRKTVLGDELDIFNYTSYDSTELDFASLREALLAPPMMSEYKLIEWKYANLNALKPSEIKTLCDIARLKSECPYAVFVIMTSSDGFDTGRDSSPTKLAKTLSEYFEIVKFDRSGDASLASWIKKHFEAEGVGVTLQSVNALIFRTGHSMEMLNNEIAKLSAYIKQNGRDTLTEWDVENLASANAEFDAFALGNAIVEKNAQAALLVLESLKARKTEPSIILSMLEKVYCDLLSVSLLIDEGKNASDIEKLLKFFPYKTKRYIASAKRVSTRSLSDALTRLQKIDAASKQGGRLGFTAIEIFITQNI